MKPILFLFTAFTLMGCTTQSSPRTDAPLIGEQQEKYENIDSDELVEKMESEPGILLDVRSPDETRDGIIEGATMMDFYEDNFKNRIMELDRDQPVYVYCASGNRSGQTAKMLKDAGFDEVYNLEGGITKWEESGKPVIKEK